MSDNNKLQGTRPADELDLGALAQMQEVFAKRAQSYRMFARLFLRPLNEEDIEGLAALKLEKVATELEGTGLLRDGFNDMGRGLHRRHTGTRHVLSTDFTMCFDGLSAMHDMVAVPYASLFIGAITGEKAILYQEPRRADKAIYRREGIEADPNLNLPDDHLSFELSFMADLSDKMSAALADGNTYEVRRLIAVSQDFRESHILAWYGAFYDLACKIVDTRFYRGVLRATFGYLEFDGGTLADLDELLSEEG